MQCDQIKEYKMGGTCRTRERDEKGLQNIIWETWLSQQPVTGPYPELDESGTPPHIFL
jgi:hypothetical protein